MKQFLPGCHPLSTAGCQLSFQHSDQGCKLCTIEDWRKVFTDMHVGQKDKDKLINETLLEKGENGIWQVNVVSPFAAVHRVWLLSNTFSFIFTPYCHFVPLTIIFALFRHYFVSRGASLQDAALVQIHIIICCACPALTRLRFSFNSQVTLYTPVSILHHITCTMKKNLVIVMIKLKCHL